MPVRKILTSTTSWKKKEEEVDKEERGRELSFEVRGVLQGHVEGGDRLERVTGEVVDAVLSLV